MLKENEFQNIKNGVALKTNKDNLDTWKKNIDEWFTSLDYNMVEKNICNGYQRSYNLDSHRFTFNYFSSGRIEIKTNDIDKLECVFLEKHVNILGVELKQVISSNVTEIIQSFTESTITDEKDFIRYSTPKTARKIDTSLTFTRIREKELIFENQEKEIIKLRDNIERLESKLEEVLEKVFECTTKTENIDTCKCICTENEKEVVKEKDFSEEL